MRHRRLMAYGIAALLFVPCQGTGQPPPGKARVIVCFDKSGKRSFESAPGEVCRQANSREIAELSRANKICGELEGRAYDRCWDREIANVRQPPWLKRAKAKCDVLKDGARERCWNAELAVGVK